MSLVGHLLPRWPLSCAAATPLITDTNADNRRGGEGPEGDIAPTIMSGLLDLRAEPDLLVAAA